MAGTIDPELVRNEKEINDMIDKCIDNRTIYPGMTYAEGVRAGIEWIIGETDDPPIED